MNDNKPIEKRERPLWVYYHVRFDFLTALMASVPANPDLVKLWLESRAPAVRPPQSRSIADIQEEVFATIATEAAAEEEPISKSLLVFQRQNGHLVQRAATVRAHIKDCARQVGSYYIGKVKGEKAFSTRVINTVYPDEKKYWLPILNSQGEPLTTIDGIHDKAVHTYQGNALKSMEFVMYPRLEFNLKILGAAVSQTDLATIFTYGGTHGYGGERSDGEGRYSFEIQKVNDI